MPAKQIEFTEEGVIIKGTLYTREHLKKLYLDQNKTFAEMREYLGVGKSSMTNIIKQLDIVKPKETVLKMTLLKTDDSGALVTQSRQVKEKRNRTNLERYGSVSPFGDPNVQAKSKETLINNFGVSTPAQSDIVRDKIKTTNLERYGGNAPAASQAVLDKMQQTCAEKYGIANPMQSEEFKNKQKDTLLKNYGVANPTQNSEIRQRVTESIRRRFGCEHALQNDECVQKFRDTMLFRYGRQFPKQQHLTPEHAEILGNRDKFIEFIKSLYKGEKLKPAKIAEILGCSPTTINRKINLYKLTKYIDYNYGGGEQQIEDFLKTLSIKYLKHQRILDHKEADFYIPEYKIAIEFNGDYWHSSILKDKRYHYNKSKAAEKQGIRLIHIYEYEWNDPERQEMIKSLIRIALKKSVTRIYARNCSIREITNSEAREFNNKNHLQGHRNAQITYGLFYKDKLVQLMSFSKTKYNRNLTGDNSWEIIRGCPGSNNLVVGGVSKLFKHFVENYHPDTVFSYCDYNKFNGKGYEALGMKFIGYTGPDMKWYMKDGSVVNRAPKKHSELQNNSMGKIWGSGSKKYLWTATVEK